MRQVFSHIDSRKQDFGLLPFFRTLEQSVQRQDIRAFVPGLTFFVLGFQDCMRVNAANVIDPQLAKMARAHCDEEADHDQWFLHDLKVLGLEDELAKLFCAQHRAARDTTYSIVGEVHRAADDRARLALIFALEATSDVFFERAHHYFAAAGIREDIRFFSEHHHDVECSHDILEHPEIRDLAHAVVPDEVTEACIALVDRVFDAMTTLMADLKARIDRSRDLEAQARSVAAPSFVLRPADNTSTPRPTAVSGVAS